MDVSELVIDRPQDGVFRIHRSVMSAPEILKTEQERIFGHCWLYVGHETELEKAGDYRRRVVGGRPLVFIRGSDDKIRVFFNTCTHRGALVCRHDEGRSQSFQCFYHGWTYNNKGELIGVPDEAGYAHDFDRKTFNLKSPRLDSYRGFHFVTFDPEIEDLQSYLGEARSLIDLTMDSAEVLGGWTILHGTAKYSIKSNWKLLAENSYDGYHLQPVHQTYLDYIAWRQELNGFKKSNRPALASSSFALRNGHGGMLHQAPGRGIANPSPVWSETVNREVERIKAENIARFGKARGRQMCEVSRHMLLFPNVAFQDSQTGFRLRQFWPVEPGLIDVLQWDLVPRNEREDLRMSRMEMSLAFLGPGGLATPDDVEALESCQQGFGAGEVEWSDISRGMQREPQMADELQMRAFWRQWHALMGKGEAAETTDDRRRPAPLFLDLPDLD